MKVDSICAPLNIPLILIRQYGQIGYIRIAKPFSCIIEPKPYQVVFKDLRVSNPFPALEEFANSFDIDNMS